MTMLNHYQNISLKKEFWLPLNKRNFRGKIFSILKIKAYDILKK